MDADASRTLAHLPKTEAGKPGRAPANFQQDLSEMTASVAACLPMSKIVSGAGERDACDV